MQILATNAVEPMRIAPCEYHGHVFVDIRVSFQDDAGAWKRTKKGMTVSVDRQDDCKDAVVRVQVPLTGRRTRSPVKAATR
jgi:Transcriptional Coactivator p15 (PC4)